MEFKEQIEITHTSEGEEDVLGSKVKCNEDYA